FTEAGFAGAGRFLVIEDTARFDGPMLSRHVIFHDRKSSTPLNAEEQRTQRFYLLVPEFPLSVLRLLLSSVFQRRLLFAQSTLSSIAAVTNFFSICRSMRWAKKRR